MTIHHDDTEPKPVLCMGVAERAEIKTVTEDLKEIATPDNLGYPPKLLRREHMSESDDDVELVELHFYARDDEALLDQVADVNGLVDLRTYIPKNVHDEVVAMIGGVEERVDNLKAQVGILAAAHEDGPKDLPPRPREPCACVCGCRLHLFPGQEYETCAWCRRNHHDPDGGNQRE